MAPVLDGRVVEETVVPLPAGRAPGGGEGARGRLAVWRRGEVVAEAEKTDDVLSLAAAIAELLPSLTDRGVFCGIAFFRLMGSLAAEKTSLVI